VKYTLLRFECGLMEQTREVKTLFILLGGRNIFGVYWYCYIRYFRIFLLLFSNNIIKNLVFESGCDYSPMVGASPSLNGSLKRYFFQSSLLVKLIFLCKVDQDNNPLFYNKNVLRKNVQTIDLKTGKGS
jgi:hypothetical protein